MAFVTANADGVTSNAIAVYVHPDVTACSSPHRSLRPRAVVRPTIPTSDCCPNSHHDPRRTRARIRRHLLRLAERSRTARWQGLLRWLDRPAHNITCQVGHLTFTAQGASNVVTIDSEGFATANQPGSTTVTATISNSNTASNAGFFSTCPPASIVLTAVGQTGNPINVGLNNPQPLAATVYDDNIDAAHPNGPSDHRHQPRVQLHHSADHLGVVRFHPSQLPRLGDDHCSLPARHLQSVAAQPARLSRQRQAAHLQRHHRQHRGQQRRGHLHGQHQLAVRRSLRLHPQAAGCRPSSSSTFPTPWS